MACKEIVFRICLGFSRNAADAEDLTQDVYLKAYQKLDGLKDPDLKKEWLFRIARNTCLDHHKKLAVRRAFLGRAEESGALSEDPVNVSDRNDRLRRLKKAVNALPKKQISDFIQNTIGEERDHANSIGQLAAAVKEEILDLQLYLDNMATKDKMRKDFDKKFQALGVPDKK